MADNQTHFGFDFYVFDEGGEVGAGAQNEQGQDSEHAADDGHGTGRLDVRAQDEQRFVGFTLLLSGTLNHTLHPQALFLNLCVEGKMKYTFLSIEFNQRPLKNVLSTVEHEIKYL